MNPSPVTQHPPAVDHADSNQADPGLPDNWRVALMTLIATRISLIELEARQSAKNNASRAIRAIVAAFCLLFAWMLLLAGGIAAVAALAGWSWHWVAIGTAALHLFLAWILIVTLKASAPAFSATRAEFQKDREWIENYQKKPRSRD